MYLRIFATLVLASAPGVAMGFDAEAFRRNEQPAWCGLPLVGAVCADPRAGMWDEVEAVLRPGLTREDVLDLLGPPAFERENALVYNMGQTGIDPDYLVIHFDDQDRLVETGFERG
jgi:hypothetical protein